MTFINILEYALKLVQFKSVWQNRQCDVTKENQYESHCSVENKMVSIDAAERGVSP